MLQLLLALGWRTRWVVDWTDHLWVEIWMPDAKASASESTGGRLAGGEGAVRGGSARAAADGATGGGGGGAPGGGPGGRWLHMDPCEASLDNPLLYSKGWGKKLTYVVALGDGTISDVTREYTHDYAGTLAQRPLSEAQVARAIRWVTLTRGAPKLRPAPVAVAAPPRM
jgi:peptide-N4-(N-acetyl-beta-glucosaminyl)asparagine amidase